MLNIDSSKIEELLKSDNLKRLDNEARKGKKAPALKFSQRFVRLGLQSLKDGKISKGRFCDIFEISRAEFTKFIETFGFLEEYIYSDEIEIDHSRC